MKQGNLYTEYDYGKQFDMTEKIPSSKPCIIKRLTGCGAGMERKRPECAIAIYAIEKGI